MDSCAQTRELFSEYFDGELHGAEKAAVKGHIASCVSCTQEYQFYTDSLRALQSTRSIEVGEKFDTTVLMAVEADVERQELFRTTGLVERPPEVQIVHRTPRWIPFAAAAGALVALLVGIFAASGGGGDRAEINRLKAENDLLKIKLERKTAEVGTPAPTVPDFKPKPDFQQQLRDKGFVEVGGFWIPGELSDAISKGMVLAGGELRSERAVYDTLAARFGAEKTAVQPGPPAPEVKSDVQDWLREKGYRLYGSYWLPEDWVAKLEGGYVMTGAGSFRHPDEFDQDFMQRYGLVAYQGQIMSLEERDRFLAQRVVKPPTLTPARNPATALLDGLHVGEPIRFENLTIYPILRMTKVEEIAFRTLNDAVKDSRFDIVDDGKPLEVRVNNRTEEDVLILAGELLTGGYACRVVAEDTIVEKKKTLQPVRVYDVEPAQWNRKNPRMSATSGRFFVSPRVRRSVIADSSQGLIWSEVYSHSPGGEQAAYVVNQEDLEGYLRLVDIELMRVENVVGLVVAVGGEIMFAEVYGSPALYHAYSNRVLGSSVVEAIWQRRQEATQAFPKFPDSLEGAKQLTEQIYLCQYDPGRNRITRDDQAVGLCFAPKGTALRVVLYGLRDREPVPAPYHLNATKATKILQDYDRQYMVADTLERKAFVRRIAAIDSPRTSALLQKYLMSVEIDNAVRSELVRELAVLGGREKELREREKLAANLITVMKKSLQEPSLFQACASALAALGSRKAIPEFLNYLQSAGGLNVEVVVVNLPALLKNTNDRKILDTTIRLLIEMGEIAAEVAAGRDPAAVRTTYRNLQRSDFESLGDPLLYALQQITGRPFEGTAEFRTWWNKREERERFFQERLSPPK